MRVAVLTHRRWRSPAGRTGWGREVGRRENDLEPDSGPLERFAHELRELRRKADNPSYRDLARRAHYSASVLSTAANGRIMPSRAVTAAYVRACGGDEQEWDLRWLDLANQLADHPHGDPGAVRAPAHQAAEDLAVTPPRPASAEAGRRGRLRIRARTPRAPVFTVTSASAVLVLLVLLLASGSKGSTAALSPPSSQVDAIAPGLDCGGPEGDLAPAAPSGATRGPQAASTGEIRFAGPADTHRWGGWWGQKQLQEVVTGEQTYNGRPTLRLKVKPGLSAVGSTKMKGLGYGDTVTVDLWYAGQGEATICPFVQTPVTYRTLWLQTEELKLSPHGPSGWRTYQWVIPDSPLTGTGFQITNTGGTDVVVYVGSVTW
jgi:hypothetical protein